MVERRRRARLELEALDPRGIVRELGRKNLDGGEAAELDVAGAVHLAHAARADRLQDLVVADAAAGFEHQKPYPSGVRAEPGSRFTNEPCLMLPTYF